MLLCTPKKLFVCLFENDKRRMSNESKWQKKKKLKKKTIFIGLMRKEGFETFVVHWKKWEKEHYERSNVMA